jgi:hypothetical protein
MEKGKRPAVFAYALQLLISAFPLRVHFRVRILRGIRDLIILQPFRAPASPKTLCRA